MRKLLTLICTIMLLLSGCASDENKVHIIENTSSKTNLMANFYELCDGTVEGFLGDTENLLVSTKPQGSNVYDFFSLHISSKEKKTLPSLPADENFELEQSSDGKRYIHQNYLVDTEKGVKIVLPIPSKSVPQGTGIPSYTFMNGNEIVLTDPFYYYRKYILGIPYHSSGVFSKPKIKNTLSDSAGHHFVYTGSKEKPFDLKSIYKSLILPENITFHKNLKLILNDLKAVFIGKNTKTQTTPLCIVDLYERSFYSIENNIESFLISPDRQHIAYVLKTTGEQSSKELLISDIKGNEKVSLVVHDNISGFTWSPDSKWIAYSGGDDPQSEIWIVRTDGKVKEMLTHGMFSTHELAWSFSGNKIAFTSNIDRTDKTKVFIITLNIASQAGFDRSFQPAPGKEDTYRSFTSLLRNDTKSLFDMYGLKGDPGSEKNTEID